MSQVRQVKDAVDLVEIIGERVNLKKTGANYRGLCPFHTEKTPSFFVSDQMQRFKCFGCGASGDVYEFLQRYEGMTFYEALQYLADRVGIKLETQAVKTKADDEREQILKALDLAAKYYHWLLTKHQAGALALDYLKSRKINSSSIKLFQLGYALNSWDGLIKYLHQKKQIPLEILAKSGLVVKGRYGRFYDRFRDRVIFPLRDHRGRVVGFSGRILTDKKEAKYINTPETTLYHKRRMLYGYAELRSEIKKANKVIVVEGEFDVIASSQVGINNVVAIKGSALTLEHGQLLKRLVESVILSLDNDEAGVEATRRAIKTLKSLDLELRVLPLAGGKDPADIIAEDPASWRKLVKQTVSAYEFLIQAAFRKYNALSVSGQKKILKELARPLESIESQVEKEFYLRKLAEKLGVSVETVAFDIKRYAKQDALKPSVDISSPPPLKEYSRLVQLERWAVMLLSVAPEKIKLDSLVADLEEIKQIADVSLWFERLIHEFLKKPGISLGQAARNLPEDMQEVVFEALADPELLKLVEKVEFEKEWRKVKADLKAELLRKKRAQIAAELDRLDRKAQKTQTDLKKEQELLLQLARLKV